MGLIKKIKGIKLAYEAGKYLGEKEKEFFSLYDQHGLMIVEHVDGRTWVQPCMDEIAKMMENIDNLSFLERLAFDFGWSNNLPNFTEPDN